MDIEETYISIFSERLTNPYLQIWKSLIHPYCNLVNLSFDTVITADFWCFKKLTT